MLSTLFPIKVYYFSNLTKNLVLSDDKFHSLLISDYCGPKSFSNESTEVYCKHSTDFKRGYHRTTRRGFKSLRKFLTAGNNLFRISQPFFFYKIFSIAKFISHFFDSLFMCRMFLYATNGSHSSSDVHSQVDPLLQSWQMASSNDQNLFNLYKVNQHDDGWGSYQYFVTGSEKNEHFSVQKSTTPVFEEKPVLNISNHNDVTNYILLNHARKASPQMPITLSQNHPYVNEPGTTILAHNGTLNKEILVSLLKEKISTSDNLSDTQILNLILEEKFGSETDSSEPKLLFSIWKRLVSQIKELHKEKDENYSMNFIFLLKNISTNNFYVFYSTVYSNPESKEYLKFYLGKHKTDFLLSSSTIIDYFMKDFQECAKSWNIELLPNNTIGIVNLHNFEKLEDQI